MGNLMEKVKYNLSSRSLHTKAISRRESFMVKSLITKRQNTHIQVIFQRERNMGGEFFLKNQVHCKTSIEKPENKKDTKESGRKTNFRIELLLQRSHDDQFFIFIHFHLTISWSIQIRRTNIIIHMKSVFFLILGYLNYFRDILPKVAH